MRLFVLKTPRRLASTQDNYSDAMDAFATVFEKHHGNVRKRKACIIEMQKALGWKMKVVETAAKTLLKEEKRRWGNPTEAQVGVAQRPHLINCVLSLEDWLPGL